MGLSSSVNEAGNRLIWRGYAWHKLSLALAC